MNSEASPGRQADCDVLPDTGLLGLALLARFHGLAVDPAQLAHQFKPPGQPFGGAEILLAAKALGLKAKPVRTEVARVRELENIRQFLTGNAITLVLDLFFSAVFIAYAFRLIVWHDAEVYSARHTERAAGASADIEARRKGTGMRTSPRETTVRPYGEVGNDMLWRIAA